MKKNDHHPYCDCKECMLEFQKYCDFKELMSNIEKLVLSYVERVSAQPVIPKSTHKSLTSFEEVRLLKRVTIITKHSCKPAIEYFNDGEVMVMPTEEFLKSFIEL